MARSSVPTSNSGPKWSLGWVSPAKVRGIRAESFVYLGSVPEEENGIVCWAVDVFDAANLELGNGGDGYGFMDLRTMMVATDWTDADAMGELAIAGHVRCAYRLILLPFCMRLVIEKREK